MSHPIHPLASWQSAVFLLNSRLGLLAATRIGLRSKSRHRPEHPFFRSYGVNLPSSLTKVLSFVLVFSTHLPVSVCGTVIQNSTLRGFSWQQGSTTSASWARTHASAQPTDFPMGLNAYTFPPTSNCRLVYLAASPHRSF